jgi:hypothetical protein
MITPLASYELLPLPTSRMTRKLESTGLKGRPDRSSGGYTQGLNFWAAFNRNCSPAVTCAHHPSWVVTEI